MNAEHAEKRRETGEPAVACTDLLGVGRLIARWEHMATVRELLAIENRTKDRFDVAQCAEVAAAAYRRCASELALAAGGLPIPAAGERWDSTPNAPAQRPPARNL